jgi:lipopolysaccharide transport system permease protein
MGLLAYYGIWGGWSLLLAPFFFGIVFVFGLGLSLFFSALDARFRDIGHTIPLLLQIWIFSTPIMYPLSIVPPKWMSFYMINPMASYIEAFRWSVTGFGAFPPLPFFIWSCIAALLSLVIGYYTFRSISGTIVDTL